jgi:hypothetical protein
MVINPGLIILLQSFSIIILGLLHFLNLWKLLKINQRVQDLEVVVTRYVNRDL